MEIYSGKQIADVLDKCKEITQKNEYCEVSFDTGLEIKDGVKYFKNGELWCALQPMVTFSMTIEVEMPEDEYIELRKEIAEVRKQCE